MVVTYRCSVSGCQGCILTLHGPRQLEVFSFCDRNPQGVTAFQPVAPAIVDATKITILRGELK